MPPNQTSNPLRMVTQRLSSTPTEQLPYVVPQLTNTLLLCRPTLLASSGSQNGKDGAESAVLAHKYKTKITALLQDKSVEARWAAVVLVKATVEVGRWEVLKGSGAWVRGIIGILGNIQIPHPPVTKKLCILTLTRIFQLTQGQQSLTRELTTPSLPAFITACINLIMMPIPHAEKNSAKTSKRVDIHSPLLETVLCAFLQLIPHHPSVFRPFIGQLKSLLSRLLAPTPSSSLGDDQNIAETSTPSCSTVALGQQLFSLLSFCAPKNAFGEDWGNTMRVVQIHFHRTADYVFRAVDEDWISLNKRTSSVDSRKYGKEVGDQVDDNLGLPAWRGVFAGTERLVGLLQLLQSHVAIASNSTVTIPVGSFLSLIERTLSILPPSNSQSAHEMPTRLNPEIERDEREGLWLGLPQIHASSIELLSLLLSRLDANSLPFVQSAMEQLLWIFLQTQPNENVRRCIYQAATQIINLYGPSLPRKVASSMSGLIRTCCADILESGGQPEKGPHTTTSGQSNSSNKPTAADNADSYLQSKDKSECTSTTPTELYNAASAFLPLTLSRIPSGHLAFALRAEIDRTAILAKHKETMFASVLNPPIQAKRKNISSILPFIARQYADSFEVEATIRPRMPLLQHQRNANGEFDDEDDIYERDKQFAPGTNFQRRDGATSSTEPAFSRADFSFPDLKERTAPAQGSEVQGSALSMSLRSDSIKRPREPEPEPEPGPGPGPGLTSTITDSPASAIQSGNLHIEEATQSVKRVRVDQDVYTVVEGTTNEPKESQAEKLDAVMDEAIARARERAKEKRRVEVGGESDESDGDEIPTIDPTLATDSEDEEDDEDEDMAD
ncbi:MAG: hypothetical protein MMC33_006343 [Icmadophila ericetorum]|nr:hypothetical protein [Icmadophila ericetorum]